MLKLHYRCNTEQLIQGTPRFPKMRDLHENFQFLDVDVKVQVQKYFTRNKV